MLVVLVQMLHLQLQLNFQTNENFSMESTMKKTLILILLCFQFTYAQGVNNNGATMHLKDGITVTVRGNYDNGADAVVNLDTLTLLSIEGSITENGGTYAGEGEVYLNGETYLSLSVVDAPLRPEQFALHHNYPNPFNPITSLRYDLPEQAQVTLTVYDLIGRESNPTCKQHYPGSRLQVSTMGCY